MFPPLSSPYSFHPVSKGTFTNKMNDQPNMVCPIVRNLTYTGSIAGLSFEIIQTVPEINRNGNIKYKINPQS